MSIKRRIFWGLGLLLALPVIAVLVVIAINQFDEVLDPKAAAWGEPRAVTVPAAENGYYALLALGAPDGADAAVYARAWLDEARAAARENRDERHPAPTRSKSQDMCDPLNQSCLDAVRAKKEEFMAGLANYKEDLARYGVLLVSSRYEEVLDYPMRVVSGLPPSREVMNAQRAFLTRAALAAEAGDIEAAVVAVERDIAYCRVMLAGARTILGKMIAARRYWTSLAFLDDLVKQKSEAMNPYLARLRQLVAAMDPSALKVGAAMEFEFATIKQILRNPGLDPEFFKDVPLARVSGVNLFHKSNATINHGYRNYSSMGTVLNLPPREIESAWRAMVQANHDFGTLSYLNNPMGKMQVDVAVPGFHVYALRLHDLDGFNRLVALHIEAVAAKINVEQAAEFAGKSEARLHDPYTGKPMTWNAAKSRFEFTPRGYTGKQPGNAFSIDADGVFVIF